MTVINGIPASALDMATSVDAVLAMRRETAGVARLVQMERAALVANIVADPAMQDSIAGAAQGYVVAATWAGLAAIAGARAGQPGRVATTDAGTHTDPVVGGTVANAGEFAWSASPAGWRRVGDVIDAPAVATALADSKRLTRAGFAERLVQTLGAAAPTVGSAATATTYVLAGAAAGDGAVLDLTIGSTVAGTVEVGVFSRSSDDVFSRLWFVARSVAPGLNAIDIGLPIGKGQHVGVTAPLSGLVTYATAANIGYFAGTLSGEAFADTAAATSLELQMRATLAVRRPDAEAAIVSARMVPQTFGLATTPGAGGANSVPGTYILDEEAPEDGIIDDIEIYAGATATVEPGLYTRDGSTWTRVAGLGRVTMAANALNFIPVSALIRKGQRLGFRSPTGGWSQYTSATNKGYFYGVSTADSVTASVPNTATQIMIRAIGRRLETAERHVVGLGNSDRILLLGPSYGAGHYNPAGKNWISKAANWTDHLVENFSFSGETVAMLLDRIRTNTVSAYAPIAPRAMNCAYVMICEGYNSANHATNRVTFAVWLESLRKACETIRAMGAIPIVATEWQAVYERGAHAALKALADEAGALFLDLVPHAQRVAAGAPNVDFWRPPTAERHPGVRTNHVIADQAARLFESLPRPRNALKLFRRRGAGALASLDDLMYRDTFERSSKWRGLLLNQVSMSSASERYLDRLTTNAADYTNSMVTQSEALLLQNGGTVALGEHALLEIVVDAEARNVERARLTLSDPAVAVYIRDGFVSPYPADGASVCRWAALTGAAGVFDLDRAALAGRIHGDRIAFLLVRTGGVTIKEPLFEWWGKAGKRPAAPPPPAPATLGGELLRVTAPAALTGDGWTGWTSAGGTITPSADATFQLPAGATGWAEVDATKSLVQSLNYTPDAVEDVEAEIAIIAGNFPALVDPAAAYPAAAAITGESFDYKRVRVDLRDPDGTLALSHTGRVGLWWDDLRLRAILPRGVGPMDISIAGPDGAVRIAAVSVKPLRKSLAAHALRAETSALLARMTVQPSAAYAAACDRLIRSLIDAGVWGKLDALYVMAAHDPQAARLNWRQAAYDLTAVGSTMHTALRGYQGDGSTGYLSSGYNPTTAPLPQFAQDNAHMGLWSLTDGVSAIHDMGAGNSSIAMQSSAGTFQTRGNSGLASGSSSAGGTGHLMWSRSDAASVLRYRNGAAASTAAVASLAPSNYIFRLCGYVTSTASYSTRQLAAAHWGASLSATEAEALHAALRRYLTFAGAV